MGYIISPSLSIRLYIYLAIYPSRDFKDLASEIVEVWRVQYLMGKSSRLETGKSYSSSLKAVCCRTREQGWCTWSLKAICWRILSSSRGVILLSCQTFHWLHMAHPHYRGQSALKSTDLHVNLIPKDPHGNVQNDIWLHIWALCLREGDMKSTTTTFLEWAYIYMKIRVPLQCFSADYFKPTFQPFTPTGRFLKNKSKMKSTYIYNTWINSFRNTICSRHRVHLRRITSEQTALLCLKELIFMERQITKQDVVKPGNNCWNYNNQRC